MLADQFVGSWEELINFDRLRTYRLARVTQALKEAGLDALIDFKADNIRYVSSLRPMHWEAGYQTRNMVIVDAAGNVSLFVASGDYQRVKENDPWLQSVRPLASMEDTGISQRVVNESILPELKRMGLTGGTIGLDATTFYTSDFIRRAVREHGGTIVDGNEVMTKARMIKCDDEIRLISAASAISDAGMTEACSSLVTGRTENRVAGRALRVMYGLGTEWMPLNPVVFSGPGGYRRFATNRVIGTGETVVVDLSAMHDGYCAETSRTFSLGRIPENVKNTRNQFREVYSEVLSKCRPGKTARELVAAHAATLKEAGFESSKGYLIRGAGLSLIDAPLVRTHPAGGGVKLQNNMVIILEVRVNRLGEGTFQASDTIHVKESGPKAFTRFQDE